MKQTIFPKIRTTRELRKRIPLMSDTIQGRAQGFTTEPDGREEIYFETLIDLDSLNEMARRAAHNHSQRCIDGALIVRVIERKRIP